MDKRRIVTAVQRYAVNPPARLVAGWVPGFVVLETRGRKTGRRIRLPVGGRLENNRRVWIVSEHGPKAGYVKNLLAEPRVRVRVNGRWRTGRAYLDDSDDPVARSKWVNRPNGWILRKVGTDIRSIRIDLDD